MIDALKSLLDSSSISFILGLTFGGGCFSLMLCFPGSWYGSVLFICFVFLLCSGYYETLDPFKDFWFFLIS